jgi:hypothetical protein
MIGRQQIMKNSQYVPIIIGAIIAILLLFPFSMMFSLLFSIFLFSAIEVIVFGGLLSFFIWLKKKQKIQNLRQPTFILCITAFSISLLYVVPFIVNNQCTNGFSLADLSKISEDENQHSTITFMMLSDDFSNIPKVKLALEQLDSDPIGKIQFYELEENQWKTYSNWFLEQQQKYQSTMKVSDSPYIVSHYFMKDGGKYIISLKNC